LDNLKHQPAGGDVAIPIQKLKFKETASSKVGSLDYADHVPGGGDNKIFNQKLEFKHRASPKVGSLPKAKNHAEAAEKF
jgi:microtubule-associated protein tau